MGEKTRLIKEKRGSLLQNYTVHIILFALVVLLFLYAVFKASDTTYIKQQVIEKQIALLIGAAKPGMEFSIARNHNDGIIQDVRVSNSHVFVMVDGFQSISGYRFFTPHSVRVEKINNEFIIKVS